MVDCNLCKRAVSNLKTNSHVIPRWMLAKLKDEGRLVAIEKDKINDRSQFDPKGEIVCEDCEERFKEDDTFSAQFFRDKKFVVGLEKTAKAQGELDYEVHNEEGHRKLVSFASSLFLRGHLFNKVLGNGSAMGPYFDKLRSAYLERQIDCCAFPFLAFRYDRYDTLITFPQKSRTEGLNHQEVYIFGYTMMLFTDKRPLPASLKVVSEAEDLFVPIIEGYNNKLSDKMAMAIRKHKWGSR